MIKVLCTLVPAGQEKTPLNKGRKGGGELACAFPSDLLQETFKSAVEVVEAYFSYRETEPQGDKDLVPGWEEQLEGDPENLWFWKSLA